MLVEGSGPGVGHGVAAGQGERVHVRQDESHQFHRKRFHISYCAGGATQLPLCRGGTIEENENEPGECCPRPSTVRLQHAQLRQLLKHVVPCIAWASPINRFGRAGRIESASRPVGWYRQQLKENYKRKANHTKHEKEVRGWATPQGFHDGFQTPGRAQKGQRASTFCVRDFQGRYGQVDSSKLWNSCRTEDAPMSPLHHALALRRNPPVPGNTRHKDSPIAWYSRCLTFSST
jgi:hypothetical protein